MTKIHNDELKRRLTECNGAIVNLGSNKYPTDYSHAGNLSNEENRDLFQNENVSDVYLLGVGNGDYYKFDNKNGDLGQKTKLDDYDIENMLSKRLDYGCVFLQDYRIDSLRFIKSNILKDILIKGGFYKALKLERSYLLGLCIWNTKNLDTVEIKSCEFVSDVFIQLKNTEINILNVTGKSLKITVQGDSNYIKIGKDVNFTEGITIVSESKEGSSSIKCLLFESTNVLADVKIERLTIKELSVIESDFQKQVLFFQININSLIVMNSSFVSSDKGRIVNCKVAENLSLDAVDFGNMSFTNCSFDKLNNLVFKGVSLSDCHSVGTSWERQTIVIPKDQRYEYFKQICKIYDLEKDVKKHNEFKALYLEEIRKNIKNKSEKLSLGLSYYTSEHGTNWWRPVYIFLTIAILNFIFINVINSCTHGLNISNVFLLRDALIMMNPAHLFSHYSFENASGGFYVWATFMRVINGYLLFQTIKSFRKFI